MRPVPLALLALVLATTACEERAPALAAPLGPTPDTFRVVFTTSKGEFTVEAIRAWAPHGVDRFYQLAGEGFFDENRFYRVLPNFIAQFGANDLPERNERWKKPLPADPPIRKNVRGTISYAMTAPDRRTHQLFINLKDNAGLDAEQFAPIGHIVAGLAVADSLNDEYGETPRYQLIATLGNKYLARMFPRLDHIVTARLVAPAASPR